MTYLYRKNNKNKILEINILKVKNNCYQVGISTNRKILRQIFWMRINKLTIMVLIRL
jgi:hypothetical protein